ncbi:MAG: hypothetical protein ACOY8P_07880 [Thermodesulfobacteriota bacterium]
MTTLPAASDFTSSTVTEAQFKTAISNLVGYLSGLLGTAGDAATGADTLGTLGGKTLTKTGAYTVLAADKGAIFLCSGTWTLSLTAAATLGGKFSFGIVNTGTGVITIDPNASELINGQTTLALAAGQSCVVTCDATGFYTISGAGGGFDSGTRMAFQQTAAPTGWTKDTTAAINDSILRLVTGTVGSGGSTAFSTFNGQSATGATTLSTAQMPSHNHLHMINWEVGGSTAGWNLASRYDLMYPTAIPTSSAGGGGSHTHPLTHSIKYYDFIIASKD